jgi:hypothetical protein
MFGKKKKEREMTKKYTWTELLAFDVYHQPKEKQEEIVRRVTDNYTGSMKEVFMRYHEVMVDAKKRAGGIGARKRARIIAARKARKREMEIGKVPEGFWECEYCEQINKSEDGKCINCGASRRHL